ncbi:ABC transporter permease [Acidicapsa dinghuensis]|uniref:ABC transporter permease n=1 Tax=Acidicapsa dinghuensis TaxID=2218256 RepID=A0ABW1EBW4_9BACT|nr:ABC transporter permease [Acidicapsa dinghuensis]
MKWWRMRERNDDLERELQSDLELEEEEQRERGLSSEEARRAARRAFGNTTLIRQQTRETWAETWGWARFEHIRQDLQFALRQFSRNRRFAIACILTLGLGIGAEATIYSVIHAVLIDPYPYRGAMRMVHLHLYDKDPVPDDLALNGPQFRELEKSPVLDGAIAEDVYTMSLTGEELPEQLSVSRMSPNAFEYFGVSPLLGREFSAADGNRVAVLSYHFWKSHYAGRIDVLGKPLQLNREDYTIIGVLPQRFAWMWGDAYVPLAYSTDPRRISNVFARTREGISDRAAELALQPLLDTFAKETPADFPQHFKVHLVHINEVAIGQFRGVLEVLFVSVSFLLVLACVNVAILMLARGEARQTEIAMRKALGAGKRRIVTQLLTESILLSAAGGALGILLAYAGVHAILRLTQPLPTLFPAEANIAVNLPVLLFCAGISMVTAILCGAWPALRASRTGFRHVMNSGTNRLAGRRGGRNAQMSLLTLQVAITILLLVCSGSTVQTLLRLLHANLGYDPQSLASVSLVSLEGSHNKWADRVHYFEQIRSAIAADPDVVSAAIGALPLTGSEPTPVSIAGQKESSGSVIAQNVNEDYFSTLRMPLLAGRMWTRNETTRGAHFALINEAMSKRYWPAANPLGATIVLNNGVVHGTMWKLVAPGNDEHFQVIGVVGNVLNHGLDEAVRPAVYVPYSMTPFDGFTISFRARTNPASLLHAIKERVHSVEPDQAVGEILTATDVIEGQSLGRESFVASLFTAFAFLALAFAASGLYSIQSYLVAQRTRELGVRIALGARRSQIVEEVTRAAAVSVLTGAAAGIVTSVALSGVFAYWTNGNARDPVLLAIVAGVLFSAAMLASVGPALTAASIDPMQALRTE